MDSEIEVTVIKYDTRTCIILYENKTYQVKAMHLTPVDGVMNKYTIDVNNIPHFFSEKDEL